MATTLKVAGWFGFWLGCAFALAKPVALANVNDATRASTSAECRHSVAYIAPNVCPNSASLEQRLGHAYSLQRGTLADCTECVRGIVIEPAPDAKGYRMHIAGLESTAVTRADCNELVDFAVYAIEASDLPPPSCTKTSAFVGISATPLMNLTNADPLLATQLRLTVPIAQGELTAFGLWLPQSHVRNQVARDGRSLNPDWEKLSLNGYGAGVDACWPLLRDVFGFGQASVLHVCGVGIWRRFTAAPAVEQASAEAELWTLGGSLGWRTSVFDSINVEIAPTLLVGLGDAATYQQGTTDRLYQYGGLEAQVRVGFSWEFVVRRTPSKIETFSAVGASSEQRGLANAPNVGPQRL